jgi:hypothetical protein
MPRSDMNDKVAVLRSDVAPARDATRSFLDGFGTTRFESRRWLTKPQPWFDVHLNGEFKRRKVDWIILILGSSQGHHLEYRGYLAQAMAA